MNKLMKQIVNQGVHIVALQLHTRNHACFSAKNVVLHAFVFLRVCMATSKFALATTAGRHRKENQNVLKHLISSNKSIIKQCCLDLFFKFGNANYFHTYSVWKGDWFSFSMTLTVYDLVLLTIIWRLKGILKFWYLLVFCTMVP